MIKTEQVGIPVRSKGRAGTIRAAKRTLVLLQVMQLIVVSMEYLITMFAMFEGNIGQKIAVVLARQGGWPSTDDHFGGFQLQQRITVENYFRRLIS